MEKILVAMSGGVDSTVTAYKLLQKGHYVEGVYMKLHRNEKEHEQNIAKLEKVCKSMGIKYHILELQDRFEDTVYNPFIDTYKRGLTPNPCVMCNRGLKFGAMVEFAKEKGFDKLATGHYVRIKDSLFAEAYDQSKDQSYFLSNVDKEVIPFIVFPLGDMLKTDVKKYAQNIPVLSSFAKQKESSEICFVEDTYLEILKDHMNIDQKGVVVDKDGNDIGEHKGYMHYTIGKRRGFSVRVAHKPHYVTNIDAKNNKIEVGLKEDLKVESFFVEDMNKFVDLDEFEAGVKIRYRSPKILCKVTIKDNIAKVDLKEPVYGLAPGQTATFYHEDKVIAGGKITQ